jgi:anthranilate 1,2-dioxygenase small subunit/terephthalate 1,2-dioxygenase oxygenase component beta subunit
MQDADTLFRLATLNTAYAACIDTDRLEDWPAFFHQRCLYKITTADNVKRGYEAGVVYADSRAMLEDRVSALRQANIYERQAYRHIIGMPLPLPLPGAGNGQGAGQGGEIAAETPFLVVRTMRDGRMDLFATGVYRDRLCADDDGVLKFTERLVICDSSRFDTLLAIPL